jgi:hypothetical protein
MVPIRNDERYRDLRAPKPIGTSDWLKEKKLLLLEARKKEDL